MTSQSYSQIGDPNMWHSASMRLHEVIWPNKYILMMFGLWPMHPNTTLARRLFANFRFIVGLSGLISLLVPEFMTVAAHWGDIGVLGDYGALALVHSLVCLKILYLFFRRRSFRTMYQHLKDFWRISDDPREREHFEQLAKLAKLATIVFTLATISNMLSFEATPLVNWMRNRRDINEGLRRRPLLLELDYPFDTQRTPIYELVFIWQSFGGTCAVLSVAGFDCTVMVFIVHVFAQFNLIAAGFHAVGRKISEQTIVKNDELRAEIGKCVAQHQHTLKVAESMSSLLSPMMFCQIMSSGMQICLSGYAVIEGDGSAVKIVEFFVLFVSLLIELVIWCVPAELLIQESTAIAETIYHEVPWFTLSPSLRRDLGFVMLRAQKACHVSALYKVMSICRITEVANAAYSYMALLRSMKT